MDHRLIGTKHPVNGKESRQIETQITKSQVNICNATVVSVKVYLDCRLTVYRNYTSFRYCKLLFSYLHIQVNLWVWQLCIITECCGLDENSSVLKKKKKRCVFQTYVHVCAEHEWTVEPVIKDHLDQRPALFKGHFFSHHPPIFSCKWSPYQKTPLS